MNWAKTQKMMNYAIDIEEQKQSQRRTLPLPLTNIQGMKNEGICRDKWIIEEFYEEIELGLFSRVLGLGQCFSL